MATSSEIAYLEAALMRSSVLSNDPMALTNFIGEHPQMLLD